MNEDNRKKVYDVLKSQTGYRDSYEDFNKAFDANEDNRKRVYDVLKSQTGYLDSYEDFSRGMGYPSSNQPGSVSQQVVNEYEQSSMNTDAVLNDNPVGPQRQPAQSPEEDKRTIFANYVQEQLGNIDRELAKPREALPMPAGSAFIPSTAVAAAQRYGNAQTREQQDRYTSLQAARNFLDEANKVVTEAGKKGKTNFVAGALRGIRDKGFDPDTWMMGISETSYYNLLRRAAEKEERGETLSAEEQQLLDAAAVNMAANAYYASDLGRGYKAGAVTAESIPFMLQFAVNPLSGAGTGIAKTILKHGIKRFGLNTAKRTLAGRAVRGAARVAGDAVAAAGVTATTGLGNVAEDAERRMAGDVQFSQDNNGNIQYAGRVNNVEDTGEAIARAFASTFFENQSEMVGNYFAPIMRGVSGLVKRIPGVKQLSASKVGDLYRGIKDNPTYKEFTDRTQWHGAIGEYAEEVYNNLASVAMGDMTPEELVDLDNNIDTFLGVGLMSAVFGGIGAAGFARDRYTLNRDIRRFEADLTEEEMERWQAVKQVANSGDVEGVREFVKYTMRDDSLTPQEKKDEIAYIYNVMKQSAMEGVVAEQTEEAVEAETQDILAHSDQAANTYTECNRIVVNDVGEMVEQPGHIVGYMGGQPLWIPDGAEPGTEAIPLKEGEYNPESIQSMPTQEVIDETAQAIREDAAEQARRESTYSPDIVPPSIGTTFADGASQYQIVQQNPEGGWLATLTTVDDKGKTVQEIVPVTEQEYYDLMQEQIDAQEAGAGKEQQPAAPATYSINQEKINSATVSDYKKANPRINESYYEENPENIKRDLSERARYAADYLSGRISDRDYLLSLNYVDTYLDRIGKDQIRAMADEESRNYMPYLNREEDTQQPAPANPVQSDAQRGSKTMPPSLQGKSNAPVQGEQQPSSEIPTDEKGNLLYHRAPVERTVSSINSEGLEPEEVDAFIQANKDAAAKQLKSIEGKAPKMGTNIAKYKADKAAWQARVADAQAQVDYWNQVGETISAQRTQVGDTTAEDIRAMGEPMNGHELAAMMLATGRLPLLQSDFKRETGYKGDEARSLFGLFASEANGGMTIERAGEQLMLADLEGGTHFFDQDDPNAGRNTILDVLSEVRTRGDLTNYIRRNREAMAERERQAEYDAYADWCDEVMHMTPEEYEAYQEYIAENNPYEGVAVEELDRIFAEAEEEIQNNLINTSEYGQEGTSENGSETDSGPSERDEPAGEAGGREASVPVLPGAQPVLQGQEPGRAGGTEAASRPADDGVRAAERTVAEGASGGEEGVGVQAGTAKEVRAIVPERQESESLLDYAERVAKVKEIADARKEVSANPTDAQKEAGNYKKGHITLDGYDITIENPKGSTRSGVDANGQPWSVTMNNDYGYIRGTEGVDGDHIDVFLSDDPTTGKVYVIDQVNEDGTFDEHKVMYGFKSALAAKRAYLSNYSPGWQGLGTISEVSKEEFRKWVDSSHRKTKPFAEYKNVKVEGAQSESRNSKSSKNRLVTDERYAELKKRMKQKLRGQMNMGIDPEILAIGTEMSVYHIEKGARKFAEYAKAMIADLGDAIRPYLKSFYNGARDLPEVQEAGLMDDMDGYDAVSRFDVANFDKPVVNVLELAETVAKEQEVQEQAETAKNILTEERDAKVDGLRPATEEDIRKNPIVFYKGKGYGILMVVEHGEQTGPASFSKPHIKSVYLHNGQEVALEDLSVRDEQPVTEEAQEEQPEAAKDASAEKKPKERKKKAKKSVPLSLNDLFTQAEEQSNEQRSTEPDSSLGGRARQETERTEQRGDDRSLHGDNVPDADGSRRVPEPAGTSRRQPVVRNQRNYRFGEEGIRVPQGDIAKLKANVEAIRTLKEIEASGQPATEEQKETLSRYVGWGGLADALNEDKYNARNSYYKDANWNSKYLPYYEQLRELLSEEEFRSAVQSTTTSHYTPTPVIRALWNIVERSGFKGGIVSEPAMGIGHIIGLMPTGLSAQSRIGGYEIDSLSGRIATQLYPDADVKVEGYETNFAPQSKDLVITNVPFGRDAPYDKNLDRSLKRELGNAYNLHNYFIAKGLLELKEGGLGVFVTSSATMDGSDSSFREFVAANNIDLVGAIRLPNNAFLQNAGTSVTADILVFRKRKTGEPSNGIGFVSTTQIGEGTYEENGETRTKPILVNEYFAEHPDMMLGEMMTAFDAGSGGLYSGASQTLKPKDGADLAKELEKVIAQLPENILSQGSSVTQMQEREATTLRNGTITTKDGKVYVAVNGELASVEAKETFTFNGKERKTADAVDDYNALKDTLKKLIAAEQSEEADPKSLRKQLNVQYDAFVSKYGTLNRNKALDDVFAEDYEHNLPLSLEEVSRVPSATGKSMVWQVKKGKGILDRRVSYPVNEPVTADNLQDVVNISLSYKGTLDIPYMARLMDETEEQVTDEILEQGAAYRDPITGALVDRDTYLSGNVREKLEEARAATESNPEYQKNVEDLMAVQPETIRFGDISYRLGTPWIPTEYINDFAENVLGISGADVQFEPLLNEFVVSRRAHITDFAKSGLYKTERMGTIDLFVNALNQRKPKVYDEQTTYGPTGKSTTRVPNEAETQAASEKIMEISDKFIEYIDGRNGIHRELERIYNDRYNNYRLKKYSLPFFSHKEKGKDGKEVLVTHYPGSNESISLREHQAKAVQRSLHESTLLAHQVGTGKTFTMITTAMEMRRLGLARKPMIVVQNATLEDFVKDFYRLYPSANVLAPSKDERSAENRKRLFNLIATGDFDAIVIPQSFLAFIPDDEGRKKELVQKRIDEYQEAIAKTDDYALQRRLQKEMEGLRDSLEGGKGKKSKKNSVKEKAKAADRAKSRVERVLDRKTDDVMSFEKLGIDALFIDEAHNFKKIGFATKMNNVKGVDFGASQRANSLLLKARWVQEKNGGRNVILATGTPITNTMAEVWTMMNFVSPDILDAYNIRSFDDFATTFGTVEPSLEFTATGNFKIADRFKSYVNVPELLKAFRSHADVVLTEDVKEFRQDKNIPKLADGKMENIVIDKNEDLQDVMDMLVRELEEYNKLTGQAKREKSALPLVVFTKAKQAAIDLRLLNPNYADNPNSKTNQVVRNIVKLYKESTTDKGTQLVFCDSYQSPGEQPKMDLFDYDPDVPRFNLYEDMKEKLVSAGIPANEIAIVNNYDGERRKSLFEKVRNGDVRILLGSTEKMGVGVNVQDRLFALHHVDAPLRPMDFEQRNGRILRQGNLYATWDKPVHVLTYGVQGTLDATAYDRLRVKQEFINQMMKGNTDSRVMEEQDDEDPSGMTFSQMAATLSGDKTAQLLFAAQNKLKRLRNSKRSDANSKSAMADTIESAKNRIKLLQASRAAYEKADKVVDEHFPHGVKKIKVNGQTFTEKFGTSLDPVIDAYDDSYSLNRGIAPLKLSLNDGAAEVVVHYNEGRMVYELYAGKEHIVEGRQFNGGRGLMSSIDHQLDAIHKNLSDTEANIQAQEKKIEGLTQAMNTPWGREEELKEAEKEVADLQKQLEDKAKENEKRKKDDVLYRLDDYTTNEEEANDLFRVVDDASEIERLNNEPTIKVYRAMSLVDGKLYPPMSKKIGTGNNRVSQAPSELGQWEVSDERPELVEKNGKNKNHIYIVKDNDKGLWVAYNPYFHTSRNPLNDQFAEAYQRPNLVTVEVEVPESELTSGYQAEGAKDPVGETKWNAGPVNRQLSGDKKRKVILSRWMRPVRIVPESEVAQRIAELIEGENVAIPDNTVTPSLLEELKKLGVKIVDGINKSRKKADTVLRSGNGVLSDADLSNANDPVSKFLGKSTRTVRQRKEFSERERRNMAARVQELAGKLHLNNVEIVTDASTLQGRRAKAKGFFNPTTGKITIVIPNHAGTFDAEQTLLHEAVAHYGLRRLFGEHFDTFLDNVFNNADVEVRRKIVALAQKNGWDTRLATEEYLASLAEDTNFDDLNASWWRKIKELFLRMLHKIGFEGFDGVTLSDNELRYILWRSYENLREPGRYRSILGQAEDIAKQYELKVGNYAPTDASVGQVAEENLLFRETPDGNTADDGTREAYNRAVSGNRFKAQEAYQDNMLALKRLQEVIEQRTGKLKSYENAYLAENQMSSKSTRETEVYGEKFFKPMLEAVGKLIEQGASYGEIIDYMVAKHGLERNDVFAERDARQEADRRFEKLYKEIEQLYKLGGIAEKEYDQRKGKIDAEKEKYYRERLAQHLDEDYSGLTALRDRRKVVENYPEGSPQLSGGKSSTTLDEPTPKDFARQLVEDFESRHDTRDLWAKVNAATKETLRKSYESGMMSRDTYNKVKGQFKHYIPLRGWDEQTAEDVYEYLNSETSPVNSVLKAAKGRRSMADDPLATIGNMAESAILQGNRNLMKQAFLNMAINHPTDVLTLKEAWYVQDPSTGEWTLSFPDIQEGDDADTVSAKVEEHEHRMRELKEDGLATQVKEGLNINYRIGTRQAQEHIVTVKRNGRDYLVYVNGNPRAAQAVNGLTNPTVESNKLLAGIARFNRELAANFTNRNPAFVLSNLSRDLIFSVSAVAIKENPRYAAKFAKNIPRAMRVIFRNLRGKGSETNADDRLFEEFLANGGETGYTSLHSVDEYKKLVKRSVDKYAGKRDYFAAVRSAAGFFSMMNRWAEDVSRFTTYMTSKEEGRSVTEAVNDAKEVTVNFNRRGAATKTEGVFGWTSGLFRNLYLFFNAAVQSLTNFARLAKKNRKGFLTALGGFTAAGFLVPWLNTLAISMLDGDDDDYYGNLPDWVRRNNLCLYAGNGKFITIPLPIELRAFYGLGEMAYQATVRQDYDKDQIAYQAVNQITELLPINPLGNNGDLVTTMMPDVLSPFWQIYENKDFTGKPIYRENAFNKTMPEWTKAYNSTSDWLVDLSRWTNELAGGDDYKQAGVLESLMNWNPAKVEHLFESYFGGMAKTINQAAKTLTGGVESVIDGEKSDDLQWYSTPVLNRFINDASDDRSAYSKLNQRYYKLYDLYDEVQKLNRGYANEVARGNMDYLDKLVRLQQSRDFKVYQLFRRSKRAIDRIRDIEKHLPEEGSEQRRKELQEETNRLKRQLLERVDELE